MRSLGEFFGHIAQGVRTDPRQSNRTVTRQTVEEEHRDTPQGRVTLRRTVIEEVELPTSPPAHQPPGGPPPPSAP